MIPISPDKVLEVKDPDGGKTIFKLRYLLDEFQADFIELQTELEDRRNKVLPLVKKAVDAKIKGKRLKKGDAEEIAKDLASKKMFSDMRIKPREYLQFTNRWVDLFLCGWSNCQEKFPEDNKPSRYLGLTTKIELFEKIMENLEELCLLSKTEVGN